jgi:hypothetical protein
MGIINAKDADTVDVSNMRYGDQYMQVLGSSVRQMTDFKKFNLSRNRLTGGSVEKMVKQVGKRA